VSRQPVSISELTAQIRELGVTAGSVLLVHTSFSKVGPVENGPLGLIQALQAVLGPNGTLVMPSMSDDDDHPFDPRRTACLGNGVVADMFWRMPGVLRSDSPHAFAAIGPEAGRITSDHPLDVPHGLDSPVGRVYELEGEILLLGVGHDANTTIHLAEGLAGVRYRRPKSVMIIKDGQLCRYDYGEIDHCCDNFNLVDQWLDAGGRQRHGPVGHSKGRLMNAQDVVATVTSRLRMSETVFLHEPGVDTQCDEARASIGAAAGRDRRSPPPLGRQSNKLRRGLDVALAKSGGAKP
jgi:aminoglycoside 3-N-acetyltransferase